MPGKKLTARLIKLAAKAGLALALLACAAVGWRLADLWPKVSPLLVQQQVMVAIAVSSVVYAGSLFLLATTWAILVNPDRRCDMTALIWAYGIASIAKYLPGNVFHLAGRHVIAGRLGISHATLALATVIEMALGVVAAVLVTLCFVLSTGYHVPLGLGSWQVWIPVIGATVIVMVALGAGLGGVPRRHSRIIGASLPPARSILTGAVLSAVFFLISGLVAMYCSHAITGATRSGAIVAGASILAWLTGFLTPGVSGGLGIREAVTLIFLASVIGEAEALSLAIVIRGITLLGDLLFLIACKFLIRMPTA